MLIYYEEDYINIVRALSVHGSKRTAAHEVHGNTIRRNGG